MRLHSTGKTALNRAHTSATDASLKSAQCRYQYLQDWRLGARRQLPAAEIFSVNRLTENIPRYNIYASTLNEQDGTQ